jgi:hypothetical protein
MAEPLNRLVVLWGKEYYIAASCCTSLAIECLMCRLTCNTAENFFKTLNFFKRSHYMFRLIWPSSSVKTFMFCGICHAHLFSLGLILTAQCIRQCIRQRTFFGIKFQVKLHPFWILLSISNHYYTSILMKSARWTILSISNHYYISILKESARISSSAQVET